MIHHPHLHCIVPAGGLSGEGKHWVSCKKGFFLPVRVLSQLFRRLFIEQLIEAHKLGLLHFHAQLASLEDPHAFESFLTPARQCEWVVYAKRPFSGPQAVLNYLSLYTHRVTIANSRLICADENKVKSKCKDYRLKGKERFGTMTLDTNEFIRRFLIHILPDKFHRIRHYGFLANAVRADKLALVRQALLVPEPLEEPEVESSEKPTFLCKECGMPMVIVGKFKGYRYPVRAPPIRRVLTL